MTLTELPTTDFIAEENKVSSHNHGLLQGRLTTLFNTDDRFSAAVELSLDTSAHLEKLRYLGLQVDRELQPDVCVYHAADYDFIDSFEDGDDILRVQKMPPLVIEVLSPSQSENEIVQKFRAYFVMGIQSCWLVSPVLKTITAYKPNGESRAYDMQDGEIVDEVLNIRLKMQNIFFKRRRLKTSPT